MPFTQQKNKNKQTNNKQLATETSYNIVDCWRSVFLLKISVGIMRRDYLA